MSEKRDGPELYQVEDRILIPDSLKECVGNVAMLLRNATITARKGTLVEVEYVDDHPQGPLTIRRDIAAIIIHGSGNITIRLKDL